MQGAPKMRVYVLVQAYPIQNPTATLANFTEHALTEQRTEFDKLRGCATSVAFESNAAISHAIRGKDGGPGLA